MSLFDDPIHNKTTVRIHPEPAAKPRRSLARRFEAWVFDPNTSMIGFLIRVPIGLPWAAWVFISGIPKDTMDGTPCGSKSMLDWRP